MKLPEFLVEYSLKHNPSMFYSGGEFFFRIFAEDVANALINRDGNETLSIVRVVKKKGSCFQHLIVHNLLTT